jgi:hypothetical protein
MKEDSRIQIFAHTGIQLRTCANIISDGQSLSITYFQYIYTTVWNSRTKHSVQFNIPDICVPSTNKCLKNKTFSAIQHSRHLLFRTHHCSSGREQINKEKSAQEPGHSSYSIFNFEGVDDCVKPILHLFPSSLVCSSCQCVKFACGIPSAIRNRYNSKQLWHLHLFQV